MRLDFPDIEGSGEVWLDVMRAICGDTSGKSILDLGSHKAPYTPLLGFEKRTYVDIKNRPLDDKEEQKYFIQSDINEFLLDNTNRKWDVIVASDVIEHFKKSDGWSLSLSMRILGDKSILFTPLGDLYVENDNDDPDAHKSGWVPEDLPEHAVIVFPNFHNQINRGAFFAWHCEGLEEDFERVKNDLKKYTWTKLS